MAAVLSLPDAASVAFAARVADLAAAVTAAQDGHGPAVEVLEGETPGAFEITEPSDAPEGTVAVIRTSGSTGMPKRTALPGSALAASADATRTRLGGDGHWLLALPLHYVAGLAVISRATLGATRLATLDLRRHFDPQDFARATELLAESVEDDAPLYTSLVPTQLTRLLASDAGRQALLHYRAVLVGGGRTPEATRSAAAALGAPVVYTYGSAETCGGCVYDGVALPGVTVTEVGSRLRLGGDMVATGYLDDPERSAEHFVTDADGTRFYITDDLGTIENGVLSVSGRIDDVINTGGVKVSAQAVQAVVESVPGVAAVLVIGVPDPDWGQCVAMGWQPGGDVGQEEADDVEAAAAAAVRAAHGPAAVPRRFHRYGELPRLGNGKPDRRRIATDLTSA